MSDSSIDLRIMTASSAKTRKNKKSVSKQRSRTYDIVYTAQFAVLIAICSWISIQTTVPFTLQTMGVFLAVSIVGGRRAVLSVVVYILLGAIGMPVFSGFTGGIGILLGSTGGYIIGFVASVDSVLYIHPSVMPSESDFSSLRSPCGESSVFLETVRSACSFPCWPVFSSVTHSALSGLWWSIPDRTDRSHWPRFLDGA